MALQGRSERADDGDLETVQDPGDPEAEHDQHMESAPGQAVKPERDIGLDGRCWRAHSWLNPSRKVQCQCSRWSGVPMICSRQKTEPRRAVRTPAAIRRCAISDSVDTH